MSKVTEIFAVEDLEREIKDGWVRVQTHPYRNLKIYNYTEKAQFERHWNDVTLNCRGLILDGDYNIIARPWKKFFNYNEGSAVEFAPDQPCEITDKMDGSLGILYYLPPSDAFRSFGKKMSFNVRPEDLGGWRIATRGSFASEQSDHATRVLNDKYTDIDPLPGWTFLFEIIYKSNRIVLDYGDMDDLVLLGAVNIEKGYYYGPDLAKSMLNWNGPVVKVFEFKTLLDALDNTERPNAEGYVLRMGNDQVKVKQSDYVELHKLVTNLTPKRVWESLAIGKTIKDMLELFPDEWHQWLVDTAENIIGRKYHLGEMVWEEYQKILDDLGGPVDRKQFAMLACKSEYRKYMFALLDGKSIEDMLWKDVEPKES